MNIRALVSWRPRSAACPLGPLCPWITLLCCTFLGLRIVLDKRYYLLVSVLSAKAGLTSQTKWINDAAASWERIRGVPLLLDALSIAIPILFIFSLIVFLIIRKAPRPPTYMLSARDWWKLILLLSLLLVGILWCRRWNRLGMKILVQERFEEVKVLLPQILLMDRPGVVGDPESFEDTIIVSVLEDYVCMSQTGESMILKESAGRPFRRVGNCRIWRSRSSIFVIRLENAPGICIEYLPNKVGTAISARDAASPYGDSPSGEWHIKICD